MGDSDGRSRGCGQRTRPREVATRQCPPVRRLVLHLLRRGRLLLRGRETRATITKAYEVPRRGRFGLSQGTALTIEYSFTEPDGTRRTDSDTVNSDWDLPRAGTVPVRYTPGSDGRSRLVGHVNWVGIGFFVVSVSVLSIAGYLLWREASEATRPSKGRRTPEPGNWPSSRSGGCRSASGGIITRFFTLPAAPRKAPENSRL